MVYRVPVRMELSFIPPSKKKRMRTKQIKGTHHFFICACEKRKIERESIPSILGTWDSLSSISIPCQKHVVHKGWPLFFGGFSWRKVGTNSIWDSFYSRSLFLLYLYLMPRVCTKVLVHIMWRTYFFVWSFLCKN